MEKMPSATNSPLIGRKSIPTIPGVSSSVHTDCDVAGTSTESTEQLVTQKNRLPLSVASMVRRFELDSSSKSRAGSGSASAPRSATTRTTRGTTPEYALKHQQVNTPLSSRTSSLSSSQGFLNALQSEQSGDENLVDKESHKNNKGSLKKSQVQVSKVNDKSSVQGTDVEKKDTFSAKQKTNLNESVISDNNTKRSVAHGDNIDNTKIGADRGSSGAAKKAPITMTSVVRAATATKDHHSSKEHKAALTAKRRATAPTASTAAAVKASRTNVNNNTTRNRSTIKAESAARSSTPPSSPTDQSSDLEKQGKMPSKKRCTN